MENHQAETNRNSNKKEENGLETHYVKKQVQ
jgi:hypothetical protein